MDKLVLTNDVWEFPLKAYQPDTDRHKVSKYRCTSCANDFIASPSRDDDVCPICGKALTLSTEPLAGFKPDSFIPFEIDQASAEALASKHISRNKVKSFLPGSKNFTFKLSPLFLPFWVFDAAVSAEFKYVAKTIFSWQSGTGHHTETKSYDVCRNGNLNFAGIPILANSAISENLIWAVSPCLSNDNKLPFESLQPDKEFILTHDNSPDSVKLPFTYMIKKNTEQAFRNTLKEYDMIDLSSSNINISEVGLKYVLFPIWFLAVKNKKNTAIFLINGQTGKISGNLSMEKRFLRRRFFLYTILIFATIFVIEWIFSLF